MSWPPLLDFYIKHKKGIADVIELEQRARNQLPEAVANFLQGLIVREIRNWNGFGDPECAVDKQGKEFYVWWADRRFYNLEKDSGPCFQVYLSSDALVAPADDDRPFLCLSCSGSKSSQRLNEVKRAIELTKWKLIGSPWPKPTSVLAYLPQSHILNFEALEDQDTLGLQFIKEAKAFSERFAPKLPNWA